MTPHRYRSLERQLSECGTESQRLQVRLSELRAIEKADNRARDPGFERAFVEAARKVLDPDVYWRIVDQANSALEARRDGGTAA